MSISNYQKGIIFSLLGVLAISPDTLVIREVSIDSWLFLFWRSLYTFIGFCILILISKNNSFKAIKKTDRIDWLASTSFAVSTVFFVVSVSLTTVANTLILLSTAPFYSAVLSLIFLKEKIFLRTILAIIIVIGSVALIMSGSETISSSYGDIFAILAAITMAIGFTSFRAKPTINQPIVLWLSNLKITSAAVVILGFDLGLDTITNYQMSLLFVDGVIIGLAFVMLTIATKYISSTEVNLVMTLEVIFGTLLVWLFLKEVPSIEAILGGIIIMLTLFIHAMLSIRHEKKLKLLKNT